MFLQQTKPRKMHGLRGCSSCARGLGRRLGDTYDPVTGTYVPSLPSADNPVAIGPIGPAGGASSSWGSGGSITIPGVTPASIPIFGTSGATAGQLFGQVPVPSSISSSVNASYLPWLVLGGGALALILVLKRH